MPHVYIPSASPKRQNPALLQESDQIAQESPQGVLREVGCLTVAAVAVAGDVALTAVGGGAVLEAPLAWSLLSSLSVKLLQILHRMCGWLSKLWSLLGPYYNTAPII